jgi:hypothetical protein
MKIDDVPEAAKKCEQYDSLQELIWKVEGITDDRDFPCDIIIDSHPYRFDISFDDLERALQSALGCLEEYLDAAGVMR